MRATTRRPGTIALLAIVALVLASCAPASAPAPTSGQAGPPAAPQNASPASTTGSSQGLKKLQFQMPWIPPTEYSYWIMAQERGFYAAEGLDVELLEGSGSGNTTKVVGAGTVNIGLADANRILAGRVQGVPVSAIMTLYYVSPVGVVSLKDKGITTLGDVVGKRLGEAPDSANVLIWRAAMTEAGLDYNKVDFVALDPKSLVPALISGQVDAILGQTQPADLQAEGVAVNVVPVDLDIVADSVLVNDSFLKQEPETVRAFLRASLKGAEYVKNHPDETLEVLMQRFPTVDRAKLDNRQKLEATWVWTKNTPSATFGLQRLEDWQRLQDLMFETKQIDSKVEVESFVTNAYLPY